MLTDNVLLEIFYFYQAFYRINPYVSDPSYQGPVMPLWEWRRLMHVCRKWRQIIFESPCCLNLQILCTRGTLFKKSLGIWPDFPIAINYWGPTRLTSPMEEDDVIAALEHPDRVCRIKLQITGPQLEKMATVLHKPSFPVLTYLDIGSRDVIHEGAPVPVLTGGFLGGSAPCLEEITLNLISFPALLPFLSSAKNLIKLNLYNVPPAGYISPDALVACLAELPRLDTLCFDFKLAGVRLRQTHPPPITRTILPALTQFHCPGANGYLEDLVAQIDCPELETITASYIDPVDDFQVAQLLKFINRSVGPSVSPFVPTIVRLYNGGSVLIDMYCRPNHPKGEDWDPAMISIYFRDSELQVSHIAPALNRFSLGFSAILSTIAYLSLVAEDRRLEEGTADVEWLHLFCTFSAVQTLHVSLELAGHVALELEAIPAERVTEVLPSLCLIYLESQPASSLKKFVAARELSDRPVIVANDKLEFDEILNSFVL
jgi:hypothetical protein